MRTGLVVGVAVVAALGLAAPVNAVGEKIVYTVASDAPLMSVVYFNAINDEVSLNSLGAQWSVAFTSQASYPMVSMDAQTSGTQVVCQVSVNGAVRDQKSASGRYAVVLCSA